MIKCSSIHYNNVILCRFITETIHQLQFYRVSQKNSVKIGKKCAGQYYRFLLFHDISCLKYSIMCFLGHPVEKVVRKYGVSSAHTWQGYLLSYLVCCCCCWGGCPSRDLPSAGPQRWAPCSSSSSWSPPAASGSTCLRCASTWRMKTNLSKIPDYQNHKAYSFLKRSQNNVVNILWAFRKKFFFYCFPTSLLSLRCFCCIFI